MSDTSQNEADVSLQWKGTEACFDFHCPCGTSQHIDAMFAYYVRCPECLCIFEMPYDLTARRVQKFDDEMGYVQGQVF